MKTHQRVSTSNWKSESTEGIRAGRASTPPYTRDKRLARTVAPPVNSLPWSGAKHRLLMAAVLAFFTLTPTVWTQYPFPQAPTVTGSTLGTDLRNAAAATQAQADVVRRFASDWGRRANSASYGGGFFQQDYANMQSHFQMLRQQFNWLGSLALQLGRPRAANAVAELDAGLNIIAELFTFLSSEFSAGTLERQTIVRTCRAFEDAMREWQREFKKNSSRIGLVF